MSQTSLDASIATAYREYLDRSHWNCLKFLRSTIRLMAEKPHLTEAEAIVEVMRSLTAENDSLKADYSPELDRTG